MNLVDACLYNNLPKVKEAILRGERDPKALLIACSKSLEMVEFLCSVTGIVPDFKCLKMATDTNSVEIFRFLIKQPSINPCQDGQYVLRMACAKDNLEIIKVLAELPCTELEYGLDYYAGKDALKFLVNHPKVILAKQESLRNYMDDEEFIKLRSQYLELFI